MATDPYADNDSMIHFMFTQTALSQTGLRMNIRDGAYSSPHMDGYAFFCGQINDNEMWETRTTIHNNWNLMDHLDEWLCIEFKFVMTATTSTIYTYINGTLEFTGTYADSYNYNAGGSIDNVIISGYTNAPDFGALAAVFYIDDVVVADEYIGPNVNGKVNGVRADQIKKINGVYADTLSKHNGYIIQGS